MKKKWLVLKCSECGGEQPFLSHESAFEFGWRGKEIQGSFGTGLLMKITEWLCPEHARKLAR